MAGDLPKRYDRIPPESIVALVFIAVTMIAGLIARCFAQNHSTIRSTQSSDLMIYQDAPRQRPVPKVRPSSLDPPFEPNSAVRDDNISIHDTTTPVRIQRGPKNL